MKNHQDTMTDAIVRIRDMLLAHQAEGRNLKQVIAYLDQTIAQRMKEAGQ